MKYGIEVAYLTDWASGQWVTHAIGALLIPVAIAIGVAVAIGAGAWLADELDVSDGLRIVGAVIGGLGLLVGIGYGVMFYGQVLYSLFRHTSSGGRAFLVACLIVVALLGIAGYAIAQLSPPRPARVLSGVAGVVGFPALVAWIADGLHRAAAAMQVAFGSFILLLVVVTLSYALDG